MCSQPPNDREQSCWLHGRPFFTKLYECVSAKVFRYIDNAKWKAHIAVGREP